MYTLTVFFNFQQNVDELSIRQKMQVTFDRVTFYCSCSSSKQLILISQICMYRKCTTVRHFCRCIIFSQLTGGNTKRTALCTAVLVLVLVYSQTQLKPIMVCLHNAVKLNIRLIIHTTSCLHVIIRCRSSQDHLNLISDRNRCRRFQCCVRVWQIEQCSSSIQATFELCVTVCALQLHCSVTHNQVAVLVWAIHVT